MRGTKKHVVFPVDFYSCKFLSGVTNLVTWLGLDLHMITFWPVCEVCPPVFQVGSEYELRAGTASVLDNINR
jgi:hypothetical protein